MMGMPRSPPKNKSEYNGQAEAPPRTRLSKRADTSHVPCKFYLQGQCQAGRMCPFSHDLESTTRPAPCKYFAKGHCKFGTKCALLHITPDGMVVNRRAPFPPGPQYSGNTQAHAGAYAQPPPPGLLSLQAQSLEQRPNGNGRPEDPSYQLGPRNGYDMPQIDYTSASPKYGSPLLNDRIASSPPQKGLSVLDAPLPNSFDSNGISMAARNGPFAASVPSRFGIESPPSSLPRRTQLGNTALQDLRQSAFGDRSNLDGVLAGSSPPSGNDEPLTFPKRPLHSERLRAPRQMMSASVGTRLPTQSFEYPDDEDDTDREEDLLPASLHDLIPDDRQRRQSRNLRGEDDSPATFLAAQRRTISAHGTPQDSKMHSPHSSSPSRYTGAFAQAQASRAGPDFVGSPLRNAGFDWNPPRSASNGDLSPGLSSPPRQASMSTLSQGLARTKLDAARSQSAGYAGTPPVSNGPPVRSSLDRNLSSGSVGRDRIEEEPSLFDMDEVSADSNARSVPRSIPNGSRTTNGSMSSRLFGMSPGKGEPTLGPIGGQRNPTK